MKKLPDYLKVSYKEETFKLKPVPETFEGLKHSVSELIPNSPSDPHFSYKDDTGDIIKLCNTKGLKTFYSDLLTTPNLLLILQPNYQELVETAQVTSVLKSNEADIINLSLLGILNLTPSIINSIKFVQTDFSKSILSEISSMVKASSVDEVAKKFEISWEVVLYISQESNLVKDKANKKVTYTKLKNIIRPSKCLEVVKDYLAGVLSKEDALANYSINQEILDLWIRLFKEPDLRTVSMSMLSNNEKLKLLSVYLTGKISIKELEYSFGVTEDQINSWAIYFCQEQKVYQRKREISAEEKYDILKRYFKGEYTVGQFQNDYGVRPNLLYAWVKIVQSGKPLTSSEIYRTTSDELEQAYNLFLEHYKG